MSKRDLPIFYVYEHWRPDKDVCFYVGKGHGKRANDMNGCRNPHHKRIQAKLARLGMCVEVRMVGESLIERDAFTLEIERIAFWRESGVKLANLTNGGDGVTGMRHTDEWRAEHSRKMKGRKLSPEHRQKLIGRNKGLQFFLGKTHTPEAREKISRARKAAGIPDHVREAHKKATTGRKRAPFTSVTIEKMRVGASIREQKQKDKRERGLLPPNALAKRVLCIEDDLVFESTRHAAEHYGCQRSTVGSICCGSYGRKTAAGKTFRYIEGD